MATQVAFSTWQTGIALLFASEDFTRAFTAAVSALSGGKAHPEILTGAFSNGFSFKNPGFGPNFWTFANTGLTLHVDLSGVRAAVATPTIVGAELRATMAADSLLAARVTNNLASAIGRDMWLRTFLAPYPRSAPNDPPRT